MVSPSATGASRSRPIALHRRYGVFTLGYLAMIYWFSSHLDPWRGRNDPLAQLVTNLYHMPLYAGLAFFVLLTVSRGQTLASHRWVRAACTLLITGVVALLDEWHQAVVPGRDSSWTDVLLDRRGGDAAGHRVGYRCGTAVMKITSLVGACPNFVKIAATERQTPHHPEIGRDAVAAGAGVKEGRRGP